MRIVGVAFLLLVLVESAAARARTEPAPELVEHARVRVTLIERKPERVVGTLLEIRPDALRLESDSLVQTIARREIRKVEMSRGMGSGAGKGARIGAIVVGLSGICYGVVTSALAVNDNGDTHLVEVSVGLGLVGALTGGGLGALIGSGFKEESWEQADLQ